MATRKFDGFFPLESETAKGSIYSWLNPDMSLEEKYDPAFLLGSYIETDEAAYWYFLECLPPLFHLREGFAVGECVAGNIYLAFFRIAGRYFAAHIECYSSANSTFYNVRDQIALNAGHWESR